MLKKLKEMLRGFGEVHDEIEYIIDKFTKLEKKFIELMAQSDELMTRIISLVGWILILTMLLK